MRSHDHCTWSGVSSHYSLVSLEEMAASWKKNLEEEVIKQKETEQNLQARYGNLLLSTLEKAEEIMVGFRAEALKQADVEDSHKLKEAKLATGEEEDVAIAMEASF